MSPPDNQDGQKGCAQEQEYSGHLNKAYHQGERAVDGAARHHNRQARGDGHDR